MPRNTLTPRQMRFIECYLVSLNATQAAIEGGYSARTASVTGAKLLVNPKIAEAIAEAQAQRAQRTEVTADRVLKELAILAFSDVRHFQVDEHGELTLTPNSPDDAWRAVSSVKHKIRTFKDQSGNTETNREIEYRLWDKNAALEKVAKHIRFYPPEKVELTGKDGGPVAVAGVELDDLTEAQLLALAAQLAKA